MEPNEWAPAPAPPPLLADEVHLWAATLPLPTAELAECDRLLAADERERAALPRLDEERARFVSVRGLLRALLARYLGRAAAEICFAYGPHGKPSLAGAAGGAGIRFNVSHAGEVALLAFSAGREVGVDVERVREVPRAGRIASRIFSPEAAREWAALPDERRSEAFMREWTRLEALSKLSGEGVWRTVMAGGQHRAGARSFDLRPLPGYVGTLAVEGEGARVRAWRYQEGSLSSSVSTSSGGSGGEK